MEQEKEVSSIIQGAKRPCVASVSALVLTSSMVQPFDVGMQASSIYSIYYAILFQFTRSTIQGSGVLFLHVIIFCTILL